MVLNPVRAKTVSQARQWKWSSYRATAGLTEVPRGLTVEEILGYFGQRRGAARQKYQGYVRERVNEASIWQGLKAQSLLGVEGFAQALVGHVTGKTKDKEIPKGQRLIGRPTLEKLFERGGKRKAIF